MVLATIEKTAKGYLVFFKAHERLLIVVLAAGLLFHLYGAGLQAWIDHDKRVSDVAAKKVQTDAVQNAQLETELNQLRDSVKQQSADIQKAMQQRAADTAKQKKADDSMAPEELTARLQKLLNVSPQDVTWSPITGNVTFTPSAAHLDADALEDLNQIKADKVNLQAEVTNGQTLINSQANFITQKEVELADEKKSHQDDVKTLKAENKKQYLRGLKHGIIIGVISGEVLRIIFTHKP